MLASVFAKVILPKKVAAGKDRMKDQDLDCALRTLRIPQWTSVKLHLTSKECKEPFNMLTTP
jgi:hypothetical protein